MKSIRRMNFNNLIEEFIDKKEYFFHTRQNNGENLIDFFKEQLKISRSRFLYKNEKKREKKEIKKSIEAVH